MSIILPKTYNTNNPKYQKHLGKSKLSYSQFSSWIDPKYRNDYIKRYFLGNRDEGNQWSDFGGDVGKCIEYKAKGLEFAPTHVSEDDIAILHALEYPENCEYEDEIVVDMGDFVIQGFADRCHYKDNKVSIIDTKTGNIDKASFYGSEEYGQTTLYCYQKEAEGYKIEKSSVTLLGRKGNGFAAHPIRLSGEIVEIETPYSKERAERLLDNMRVAAQEISKYYEVYNKLLKV